MTPHEWLEEARKLQKDEWDYGCLHNYAASKALEELIENWEMNTGDVSPRVLVHDLKEVIELLGRYHAELSAKLPGVLDEIASITK